MTETQYAKKFMDTGKMLNPIQADEGMDRNYRRMKKILSMHQKIILENGIAIEELEQECHAMLNENFADTLQYVEVYDYRLDVRKLRGAMSNLLEIYKFSALIFQAKVLMKLCAPNGKALSEVIDCCYYGNPSVRDVDAQSELGYSRSKFYTMKKEAVMRMGYYFFEIVLPQS